jgi:ankyrin repeat protein
MSAPSNELMDPITLDWLEDPISLGGCCGRVISRLSLTTALANQPNCPLCQANLSNFDAQSAPMCVNIAYMVEEAKAKANPPAVEPDLNRPAKWKAKLFKLQRQNSVYQSVIGRLEITNTNQAFNFKTLLIPVIDKSGSMAGNPIVQAQYSLNRIIDLSYANPNIVSQIVTYDDSARIIPIDCSQPIEYYRQIVRQIQGGCGTSFRSAFDRIVEIATQAQSKPEISSIAIIFLTDGEDSSVGKDQRAKLAQDLKAKLAQVWKRDYVLHSVGFGGGHDFDFLNCLRQIGTSEGAYRYANPGEDSDSLSNKINSLLNVIASGSAIPMKLLSISDGSSLITIKSGENGQYWLDLTPGYDLSKVELELTINNAQPERIAVDWEELHDDKMTELWGQWYTNLIDQIATEILLLSKSKIESLDQQIHCEVLQHRSRSILPYLDVESSNAVRLQQLMESLKVVKAGGQVNQQKLNDMKFEGKNATATTAPKSVSKLIDSVIPRTSLIPTFNSNSWQTIPKPKYDRCTVRPESSEIECVCANWSNEKGLQWLSANVDTWKDYKDSNESNILAILSSIGRCHHVEVVLNIGIEGLIMVDMINAKNKHGHNAMDLTILFGYWKTYDLLKKAGGQPSLPGQMLLRSCLSSGYVITAGYLLRDKFAQVEEDMADSAPTQAIVQWLSSRTQKEISLETAISKCMLDIVEVQLAKVEKISLEPYMTMFSKPTPDQVKLITMLFQSGKVDPHQTVETMNTHDNEKELIWPLYLAAEMGQTVLVNQILSLPSTSHEIINRQNCKGRTALWIASCGRHVEVVEALLNAGADPNVASYKGDSPLVPACQKGAEVIIELLLAAGVDLNRYDQSRDNPILTCCRTGQARSLEILLKTFQPEALKAILVAYAKIDGFPPLLASAELDKVDCIRVCHNYGADLEWRTEQDNQILSGATALHLACFYGRLNAVRTLCDLGSDILSQTTTNGWTPIHLAIKQGHVEVVRYLMTRDKDKKSLNMTDNEGKTPMYYANMQGNEALKEEFFTNPLAVMLDRVLISSEEMTKKCALVLAQYGRSEGCFEYADLTNLELSSGLSVLSQSILNGNVDFVNVFAKGGVDFNQKDSQGIPPTFWAQAVGLKIPGLELGELAKEMIERVHQATKSSVQNRLLTNLSSGQNQSLLGFMDKLKKIFPGGQKQNLDSVIWDAKIHLLKMIAHGETKLQPIHLLALYLFTGQQAIMNQVNLALSDWQSNSIWQPFIQCLYQGLKTCDTYEGEVYRAVDCPFSAEDYQIGNQIEWGCFSTCSTEWKTSAELIAQKKGIIFIVKSQTGRQISQFSKTPVDKEVMFLPGSKFRIVDHYVGNAIALGQSNIRKTSYKMEEKDYVKAVTGKLCVMIELEEVNLMLDNAKV